MPRRAESQTSDAPNNTSEGAFQVNESSAPLNMVTDCPMEPKTSEGGEPTSPTTDVDCNVARSYDYHDFEMRQTALAHASAYAIESIKQRGAHDFPDTVIKRAVAYLAFLRGE